MTCHICDRSFIVLIAFASLEEEALYNVGAAYLTLEQYFQALKFFQLALPSAVAVENHPLQASILSRLSIAYAAIGQFDRAAIFFQQAVVMFSELQQSN